MNAYETKIENRRQQLEERAERLRKEGEARVQRARDMASIIPFGQPILVGHHSEKGDRAYRGRIRGNFEKGFALQKAAGEAEARAAAVGSGGISSDDPDAVAKLSAQLAEAEALQEAMKARNVAWRKAGNKAGRQADGTWVDPPCASYQLSNNSANIARIKLRIEQLKKAATQEHKEVERQDGLKIIENVEANRIQIVFPDKPAEPVRAILKSNGFRWAPSEGAWQRHLNNAGRYAATYALREIDALFTK
jgi:hypothetical protein